MQPILKCLQKNTTSRKLYYVYFIVDTCLQNKHKLLLEAVSLQAMNFLRIVKKS